MLSQGLAEYEVARGRSRELRARGLVPAGAAVLDLAISLGIHCAEDHQTLMRSSPTGRIAPKGVEHETWMPFLYLTALDNYVLQKGRVTEQLCNLKECDEPTLGRQLSQKRSALRATMRTLIVALNGMSPETRAEVEATVRLGADLNDAVRAVTETR